MTYRSLRALALAGITLLVAACDSTKSSNPLSPTVAGPIAGVTISAPKLLTPAVGQRIAASDQPLTLVVENASTTGQRPLKYAFEIAADAAFTNKLFSRSDVEPGTDGRTSLRLSDVLATGRTYYWRAMAADGANSGPYASSNFDVYTPVTIAAPVLVSPIDGVTITGLRPTLKVKNATRSGAVGVITYTFQISESQAFAPLSMAGTAAEGTTETTFTPTQDLPASKTYYWRARAQDATTTGAWSATQAFKTPGGGTAPPPPPPPSGGDGADQIPASTITWLSPASTNVSSWAITSRVTEIVQEGDQICVYHTKAGDWPLAPIFGEPANIEGNIMIVAKFSGKWYGAGFDWLGEGRTCKTMPANEYGSDQVRVFPMDASWAGPRAGDQIGLLVSTPSSDRIPMRTVNERSNIVLVTWK